MQTFESIIEKCFQNIGTHLRYLMRTFESLGTAIRKNEERYIEKFKGQIPTEVITLVKVLYDSAKYNGRAYKTFDDKYLKEFRLNFDVFYRESLGEIGELGQVVDRTLSEMIDQLNRLELASPKKQRTPPTNKELAKSVESDLKVIKRLEALSRPRVVVESAGFRKLKRSECWEVCSRWKLSGAHVKIVLTNKQIMALKIFIIYGGFDNVIITSGLRDAKGQVAAMIKNHFLVTHGVPGNVTLLHSKELSVYFNLSFDTAARFALDMIAYMEQTGGLPPRPTAGLDSAELKSWATYCQQLFLQEYGQQMTILVQQGARDWDGKVADGTAKMNKSHLSGNAVDLMLFKEPLKTMPLAVDRAVRWAEKYKFIAGHIWEETHLHVVVTP